MPICGVIVVKCARFLLALMVALVGSPVGDTLAQSSLAGAPAIVFMFCKTKGAIGIAQDDLPQRAAAEAVKNCLADNGNLDCCQLVLTIQKRDCGAVAWDPDQGNRYEVAGEDTADAAHERAAARCAAKGLNCTETRAQCFLN